jgi:hypothetical protein
VMDGLRAMLVNARGGELKKRAEAG